MEPDVTERLAWAERTAVRAGQMLMKSFRSNIEFRGKSSGIVTDLDRRAEDLIVEDLRNAFPRDGLLSEEGASREDASGWRWIVDPLDGTTNYVSGLPYWSTSLACLSGSTVELGVVHAPALSETFTARRGEGAYGPEGRLTGRPGALLDEAVFLINKSYAPAGVLWESCRELLGSVRAFRYQGCISLDLTYVAAGRVDGLVLLPSEPWDTAAGIAMLEESGVRYRTMTGERVAPGERSGIVACHAELLDEVLSKVRPLS